MRSRETAVSKEVEYETATCIHCGDEVFVDNNIENVDGLPEAVTVVVGGGEHISVEQTDFTARAKDYRTPKIITKWFFGEKERELMQQYMCQSCADAVYDFST